MLNIHKNMTIRIGCLKIQHTGGTPMLHSKNTGKTCPELVEGCLCYFLSETGNPKPNTDF
jgi:hypothetical protein